MKSVMRFVMSKYFQSHMATHTSSYWCVYCERSFRNEYNFKQHQTVRIVENLVNYTYCFIAINQYLSQMFHTSQ